MEKHMQVHYFNTLVSHSVENDTIMINHSLLKFNENIRNWMYGAASRGCKRAEAKLQSVNHPGTKFVNEWHINHRQPWNRNGAQLSPIFVFTLVVYGFL